MVIVKQDLCIGCAMCVNACPIGAVTLDPVDGLAVKCDLCEGDPQCILYCPAKVLKLTDAGQMARHRMKEFARFLQTALPLTPSLSPGSVERGG
jgi:Fe-S-cluster-containing hydrogenase component 2